MTVLVRPEALTVAGEDDGQFKGTVTSLTFQGADTVVGVRLDVLDALVSARSESTRVGDLVIGERVGVNVDTRHAVCEPA